MEKRNRKNEIKKHRIKHKIKLLEDIEGPYVNYAKGDVIEASEFELEQGYIIQGFKDYAYINKNSYEIIC